MNYDWLIDVMWLTAVSWPGETSESVSFNEVSEMLHIKHPHNCLVRPYRSVTYLQLLTSLLLFVWLKWLASNVTLIVGCFCNHYSQSVEAWHPTCHHHHHHHHHGRRLWKRSTVEHKQTFSRTDRQTVAFPWRLVATVVPVKFRCCCIV